MFFIAKIQYGLSCKRVPIKKKKPEKCLDRHTTYTERQHESESIEEFQMTYN